MKKLKILTNNPRVRNVDHRVIYHEKSVLDICRILRDRIHFGAKLLSDPMPASRRMMESPFRSLVIEEPENGTRSSVDLHSLETIERAIHHYERIKDMKVPVDDEVIRDFQYVDEELLQSTLKELGISKKDLYFL